MEIYGKRIQTIFWNISMRLVKIIQTNKEVALVNLDYIVCVDSGQSQYRDTPLANDSEFCVITMTDGSEFHLHGNIHKVYELLNEVSVLKDIKIKNEKDNFGDA